MRHKGGINFDLPGDIWFNGHRYTLKEFAAKINKDDERVCHKELAAAIEEHSENCCLKTQQRLAHALMASKGMLAQATEPNG